MSTRRCTISYMSDLVPLTGESLALDLINTRTAVGDVLATADGLRNWLAFQEGRIPEPLERLSAADLDAVRVLRQHTTDALECARQGVEPSRADLRALDEAQLAAPAINESEWNGAAVLSTRRRSGAPAARLIAWLAEASSELLADPDITKVRKCQAEDCVLLFLPANPRRRWCSATRCGNRARVARHYQRNKAG